LMHPIFQWLDYRYHDYGGFVRAVDDREIGGHRNRFTVGLNIQNGTTDANQYVNIGANKGAQTLAAVQRPENYTLYAENAWYVTPAVSLIAGAQYLHAVREQQVDFTTNPATKSGTSTFDLFSPKIGLLWDVDPGWQVFANVSRSGEAPSFGEGNGTAVPFYNIKAQTATTYEIGTRGRRPDVTWDLALYHADIKNELQCFFSTFGTCNVTNADKTMHQGVEAGLGISLFKGLAVNSDTPDRVWLNLAYTYSDFRYSNDATWGQQPPAWRAAALPARGAALQASRRLRRRPECRMGAGVLFRRQRQHAEDRALSVVGPEGDLRRWQAFFGLSRGPQPRQQGLHRHHDHH